MVWDPYPPLPLGAVRDLLGVARGLYLVAREAADPDATRLESLERVGKTLQAVLGAASAPPGTGDHVHAWAAAEGAVRALRELTVGSPDQHALVDVLSRRVARPGSMG